MIEGKKFRKQIDRNDLLSRINPLDVYQFYIPSPIDLNRAMCSPFRNDRNPSFVISDRDGKVHHFDFSDEGVWGNCIDFVMKLYNLPFKEALERINYDMNVEMMPQIYTINNEEEKRERVVKKKETLIQVVSRKFDSCDLKYWNEYYQDESDLKREDIYVPKKIYLNRERYPLKSTELVFAYLFEDKWKIYFPFADKKKGEVKWMGNVPLTRAYGLNNLNKEYNSLICKSKKDYMVCRKIYEYTCGVQNESIYSFSDETINTIKNNSKIVFYGGDSDEPGKKASYNITETLNYKHINPVDRLLPNVKDFAAWGRQEGLSTLDRYFKKKGLIVI